MHLFGKTHLLSTRPPSSRLRFAEKPLVSDKHDSGILNLFGKVLLTFRLGSLFPPFVTPEERISLFFFFTFIALKGLRDLIEESEY